MAIDFGSQYRGEYNPAYVIPQIPEGSFVRLQDSGQVYLKKGSELIPYNNTPAGQIISVPMSIQTWNKIGNVRPESYAIGAGQTPEQAEAKYQAALNDTTTPRIINGQVVSGVQALQMQQQQRDLALNPPKTQGGVQIASAGQQGATQNPQNQLYQNEYNRIAAQYPNDPQRAMQVFKAANPGAPANFSPQQGGTSNMQGTGTVGNMGATSGNVDDNAKRQALIDYGVDPSKVANLDPNALAAAYASVSTLKAYAAGDKAIIPTTAAEMQQFLTDAQKQLAPEEQDAFNAFKADLGNQMALYTGNIDYQNQVQQQQFIDQQRQLGQQNVEAGLARSGIRQEAERRLAESQKGLVQSQRRQQQADISRVGLGVEQQYGQQGTSLLPTIQSPAMAGLPAQQIAYQPIGIQKPTVPAANLANEIALQQSKQQQSITDKQNALYSSLPGFNPTV